MFLRMEKYTCDSQGHTIWLYVVHYGDLQVSPLFSTFGTKTVIYLEFKFV